MRYNWVFERCYIPHINDKSITYGENGVINLTANMQIGRIYKVRQIYGNAHFDLVLE